MLLKKLVAVVSAVVVITVPYVKVLADDTVITLDETAKKFVVVDKNLGRRVLADPSTHLCSRMNHNHV